MNIATVIGASGLIGSALAQHLRSTGITVLTPKRGEDITDDSGDLFFCAGLTADFRSRLLDTVEAHVTAAAHLLKTNGFKSFTYLSSTRVYQRSCSGHEDALLGVVSSDPSDVYNLSKLTGEAICLADPREKVRVVRLSNVFAASDASDNFLTSVVREARSQGRVHIQATPATAKDYIALADVVAALARVPHLARSRLLNIASGASTTNGEIGGLLKDLLGANVSYGGTEGASFPDIDNRRMREELGISPTPFRAAFTDMIKTRSAHG